MATVQGIPLKKRKHDVSEVPDILKCIICQTNDGRPLIGTDNGRKKLLQAAERRGDEVFERLGQASGNKFLYHMDNTCYKSYTHRKAVERICAQSKTKDQDEADVHRTTRQMSTPRPGPIGSVDNVAYYKLLCVVCGSVKCHGTNKKWRISESNRAKKFLQATVFLQDEVYRRTCDLQDEWSVYGADLYCHKNCISTYLMKYDRATKSSYSASNTMNRKQQVMNALIEEINPGLQRGEGFTLSSLRCYADQLYGEDIFTNREIKVLLCDHYPENSLRFSIPTDASKSAMVFMSVVSTEAVADQLRSRNTIIKESAEIIRTALCECEFGLQDRFCDAFDLETSWNTVSIPEPLQQFFATLFNLDVDNSNKETEELHDRDKTVNQSRKMYALFQIMYYIMFNGTKKTPLHVMLAQMIHDICKSKTLITALNHMGLCISYNEVLRQQADLASFVVQNSADNVPMPSHFRPELFTLAAFDNFDHEEATPSGIAGSHDTVFVLFQERSGSVSQGKPKISETNVRHGSSAFNSNLACQNIQEFIKPAKRPELPQNYTVCNEKYTMNGDEEIAMKEFAWALGRLDVVNYGAVSSGSTQPVLPSWKDFNMLITSKEIPCMNVGFLPLIPQPVSSYDTVYTSLKNFQSIRHQLRQGVLPVACDEGVYHIAREIMFLRQTEFHDIVLLLGSFHMTKVFLGCIGKYLRGSGAEHIWIENSIFGVHVTESVLKGSNYVRSFKGILLLAEAMNRLRIMEFLKQSNISDFTDCLELLQCLQLSVNDYKRDVSINTLQRFIVQGKELKLEFDNFVKRNCDMSETFKYWNNFLDLAELLKNLVRADREGDWHLHLHTVQRILPVFAAFDSNNYLRWCSVYLEDMRQLPNSAKELYDAFCDGKFVVKRTDRPFNAVGLDMALEQTINRSSKSTGGIIGSTKRKNYVTKWEMVYHERLAISNTCRELTAVAGIHQYNINKPLERHSTTDELQATSIVDFVQRYTNPFKVEVGASGKLQHILSNVVITHEDRTKLLNFMDVGSDTYTELRTKRLLEKSASIFSTIHRLSLPTFTALQTTMQKQPTASLKKAIKKNAALSHRLLELATARGYDLKELFAYDLTTDSYLFDGNGLLTKPDKRQLCTELEKNLSPDDYVSPAAWEKLPSVYVIDFMANIRKMANKKQRTFDDLFTCFLNFVHQLARQASRIDFVFDSYIDGSIKDSERQRRITTTVLELASIQGNTPLPINMNTFWASGANKTMLQGVLREWIMLNHDKVQADIQYVFSGTTGTTPSNCISMLGGNSTELLELNSGIEEADLRIISHVEHAVRGGFRRVVVVSADTDILVLSLHYWSDFKHLGIQELWMRAGVGNSTRHIPVHKLALNLGKQFCDVLPAAHALTGCDVTSKVGTKLAAISANPVLYLEGFGTQLDGDVINEYMMRAEEYLVQVMKNGTSCKTMDELRYWTYHNSKSASIEDLPPPSYSTRAHILRAIYFAHLMSHCLNSRQCNEDPLKYGYEIVDGLLYPTPCHRLQPSDLLPNCNCGTSKCSTRACICRKNSTSCCKFCKCSLNNQVCMNAIEWI